MNLLDRALDLIVQDICELPDRSSPDDWPEAMLVTPDELRRIVVSRFRQVFLSAEVGL
jgi:hypothetical protein